MHPLDRAAAQVSEHLGVLGAPARREADSSRLHGEPAQGHGDERSDRTGRRERQASMATHVLVVEDDESDASAIRAGLELEGFSVTCVGDGNIGLELFYETGPDLVILDVILPGPTGIDICRRIRDSGSSVPVIAVSASSEELDVVLAIEGGADDFLAKPFRMRELVARVRAVLRRSSLHSTRFTEAIVTEVMVPDEANRRVLVVDDLVLDPDRHEVRKRGELVELTRQEFRLLEELMRKAGLLVRRQALLERIWGAAFDGDGKILSTLVNRLRARIEDEPDRPDRIVTIRGLGYRFERPRRRPQAAADLGSGREKSDWSCPADVGDSSLLLLGDEMLLRVEQKRKVLD